MLANPLRIKQIDYDFLDIFLRMLANGLPTLAITCELHENVKIVLQML